MKALKKLKSFQSKRIALALGTFDGVHRGHQRLFKALVKYAREKHLLSIVLTFDPHPRQVISPAKGLKLLTTLNERIRYFKRYNIDYFIVLHFTQALRNVLHDEFVRLFLVKKLNVHTIFVGYDYGFGKGKQGGVEHLRELAGKFGFKVREIQSYRYQGRIVKSRRLRRMISNGNFNQALQMLGHAYPIEGKIIKGHGRGKRLGFCTANIHLVKGKLVPNYGVYAAVAHLAGKKYPAVVNVGVRPTFSRSKQPLVEAHLIGFSKNIRGHRLSLDLVKKLREERKFISRAALIRQIKEDISVARKCLS